MCSTEPEAAPPYETSITTRRGTIGRPSMDEVLPILTDRLTLTDSARRFEWGTWMEKLKEQNSIVEEEAEYMVWLRKEQVRDVGTQSYADAESTVRELELLTRAFRDALSGMLRLSENLQRTWYRLEQSEDSAMMNEPENLLYLDKITGLRKRMGEVVDAVDRALNNPLESL